MVASPTLKTLQSESAGIKKEHDDVPSRVPADAVVSLMDAGLAGYLCYLPTVRSVKEPGIGGPRARRPGTGDGALAGTGPYSNAMVST